MLIQIGAFMYSVFVFLRKREFSITARQTDGARLDAVIDQMDGLGFSPYEIISGIDKLAADRIKGGLSKMFSSNGFRKYSRKALS